MSVAPSTIDGKLLARLPAEPHAVARFLAACRPAKGEPGELRAIVLQDGALCARLIDAASRLCPAAIDPAAPVASALAALTPPVVKSIALQSAQTLIASRFTPEQAHCLRHLWFAASAASALAEATAQVAGYPAPEEAQATALLTHVGRLAFFAHDPEAYMRKIGAAAADGGREDFQIDHLQLAHALVSGWGLDSFMAEAIRFAPYSAEQSQGAATLVRIGQLVHDLAVPPLAFDPAAVGKAGQLLGLPEAAVTTAFGRAESLCRAVSPFDCRPEESHRELAAAGERLTTLVFSLLEAATADAHLFPTPPAADPAALARQLCLYHAPAREALCYRVEPSVARLVPLPAGRSTRLAAELGTPLAAANLVTAAVNGDRLRHSFESGEAPTVFDRQLMRACRSSGIACLPLRLDGRPVGAVVLGVDSAAAAAAVAASLPAWLAGTLARSLAAPDLEAAAPGAAASSSGDLLPRLAHEISNPLTIINNYLHVLRMLDAGRQCEEILTAVAGQTARIDDILDYYRTGGEGPRDAEAGVDINTAVQAIVASLRPTLLAPKKIDLVTDLDTAVGPVAANPVAVRQILINLLTNAVEAVPAHGRIVVASREQVSSDGRRHVAVTVTDNGPGIDRQIMGRLFAPVTSTKGGNHAGLGLSIAKGMADDIGAVLSCHSSAVSGTSFSLSIPRPHEFTSTGKVEIQ